MNNLVSRVTVFSVGVDQYIDRSFKPLRGVRKDLDNIKQLLTGSSISIYSEDQFVELYNPDNETLRVKVNEYVTSRTADGDILLFYFSGHGVAIGRNDFGFCTTDSIIHPLTPIALPTSVFKFSDLLSSLYIANIIPVIVIDACYSGIAGKSLNIPVIDAISSMKDLLHSIEASSFALLCSCTDNQTCLDTSSGGLFSYLLFELTKSGLEPVNQQFLSLLDLYPYLSEALLSHPLASTPRLFVGPTLPRFPICKNAKFSPQRHSMTPYLANVLKVLWNEGEERTLSPHEIGEICGEGAYGNHNKLSADPWQLVEKVGKTMQRRLTERGREFVQGKLKVPKTIIKEPDSGRWFPMDQNNLISIDDIR